MTLHGNNDSLNVLVQQGSSSSVDDTTMMESVEIPSTLENSVSTVEVTATAYMTLVYKSSNFVMKFVQTSTQITVADVGILGNNGSSSSLQVSGSQLSSVRESDWERRIEGM